MRNSDAIGGGSYPQTPDAEIYQRRWMILGVLVLSLVMVVAGNASLNVALPTLSADLQATQPQLQWLVDAYALVFAGLLLPAGAIGDRFGRKGALQFGLVVFGGAATLASLMTTPWPVISMRALMGVGAAFIMPSTLSILTATFPPRERPRAIAIWAGFAGTGAGLGMVLSGLLIEYFSWHSVFLINVPLVLIALGTGVVILPTSRDEEHRPLDVIGAALSVIGLGSVLYSIIEGPAQGWSDPTVLAGFAVGAIGLVAFWRWEGTTSDPMLDFSWFRDRRFATGSSTIALAFFANFGLFFVLTQMLQFAMGYTALEAALAALPLSVLIVISANRSSFLVDRFGPRKVITGGLIGIAVSFLVFASLNENSTYLQVLPGLLIFGASAGFVMPPATTQIMTALPTNKAGVGSAVNDTAREVGGALGIAILGSIVSTTYRSGVSAVTSDLPREIRELAETSVGAAIGLAEQMPDPDAFFAGVASAFASATRVTLLAGTVITLINAALVWRFAPRRSSFDEVGAPAPVVD